jgi:hypothetical protein
MNARIACRISLAFISLTMFLGFAGRAGAQVNDSGYSILHSFCHASGCTDGAFPTGRLFRDAEGYLYGATESGGIATPCCDGQSWFGGTLFKLSPPAQPGGAWTETVLYSFCPAGLPCTDGSGPLGNLIQDSAGNFYGVTGSGGNSSYGGTVFKLSPPAEQDGAWAETVLYRFCPAGNPDGPCTDGYAPTGALIIDESDNLYGTTGRGGKTAFNGNGGGVVFRLAPPAEQGGAWTESVVYEFCSLKDCADGADPGSGLVRDAEGNLYGTTENGGSISEECALWAGNDGCGTVFKIAPPAKPGDAWNETVLYSFCSSAFCADGEEPQTGVIEDSGGNLYGTTLQGGGSNAPVCQNNPYGISICGSVFKLAPPAETRGAWSESVLEGFCSQGGDKCTDGFNPRAGLVQDTAGNLYGTASSDGGGGGAQAYAGTLFKVMAPAQNGGAYLETVLHSFCSTGYCSDGEMPFSPLIEDAAGNLYGMTPWGGGIGDCIGTNDNNGLGCGTVFKIEPTVATPHFSPGGGAYTTTQTVEISDATPGATIYYTIGTATPTTQSTRYSNPITVATTETINALAVAANHGDSAIDSATFTYPTAATPVFSVAGGKYTSTQTVRITDATTKATIFYTIGASTPSTLSTKYTGPITVETTETINAIAIAPDFGNSALASATYIFPTAATPIFSIAGGKYASTQSIKITDATANAVIYYTIGTTAPTLSSTRYTGPIAVSTTERLNAIAIAPDFGISAVATATYTFPAAPTPTFSPAAGTYTSSQTVRIADSATVGLAIYYTTDGSAPTTASTEYTSAGIQVTKTKTIKAIAIATNYSQSAVASGKYTIIPPAPTPTFTPAAGTDASGQIVKIADSAATGLVIYYTTSGNPPTLSSAKYTSAGIKVSKTETIKAFAVATGYSASAIASAAYTVK